MDHRAMAVRFEHDGVVVLRPIVSLPSSLMNVVADHSYQGLRIFALIDPGDTDARDALRAKAEELVLAFRQPVA